MRTIDSDDNAPKEYQGTESVLVYTPATQDAPATKVLLSESQLGEYQVCTSAENVMLVGTDEEIQAEAARLGL